MARAVDASPRQQPRPARAAINRVIDRPWVSLTVLFVAWKILLLVIAAASPGVGYDTSTAILYRLAEASSAAAGAENQPAENPPADSLSPSQKLVRWDGIYFVSIAHRGHLFEQEWAFSWGFTRLTALVAHAFARAPSLKVITWTAVILSHLSHWLSVLVLHRLAGLLVPGASPALAFTTACLHIVSPAGLFLSAPVAESMFALCNFAGMLCYCSSAIDGCHLSSRSVWQDAQMVAAGLAFGIACTLRGNGILSGSIFLADLAGHLYDHGLALDAARLRYYACVILAGMLVAVGFAVPQIIAYLEFCTGSMANGPRRPWCSAIPPSIFSFVQDHYWNNGFLRYWTLSNLPLFIIAAPVLYLLFRSGWYFLAHSRPIVTGTTHKEHLQPRFDAVAHSHRSCAVPQLLLAGLAITSLHVQIINRISSGYPLWYLYIAMQIAQAGRNVKLSHTSKFAQWSTRWMVMYAMIQGGLFASFLPPA